MIDIINSIISFFENAIEFVGVLVTALLWFLLWFLLVISVLLIFVLLLL